MATPNIAQVLHTEDTRLQGTAVAQTFANYDGFFRNDRGDLSDESADKRKVRTRPHPLGSPPRRPATAAATGN